MPTKQSAPTTIAQYIQAAPNEAKKHLRVLHDALKKGAPKAVGSLKWHMPSLSLNRILVSFGAAKHHVGLYPTPSVIKAFAKELKEYKTSAGGIQFPFDKPIPKTLVTNIMKFRVKELTETDRKWIER